MANNLHPKYGWGWRTKNRKLQKFVTTEVRDPHGSVDDFHAQLRETATPFDDAQVTTETEYGTYGDRDRDFLAITGWRLATPEEIATADAAIEQVSRNAAARQEQEIAHLRATRPDLFKN